MDLQDTVDRDIYSSIILADGAAGEGHLFVTPFGQPIPELPHDPSRARPYSDVTTNIREAGRLGNFHGDAAIYGIAAYLRTYDGSPLAWERENYEYRDRLEVLDKCFFGLRVASREYINLPLKTIYDGRDTDMHPPAGKSGENLRKYPMNAGRNIEPKILCGREDHIEGILRVEPGSILNLRGKVTLTVVLRALCGRAGV